MAQVWFLFTVRLLQLAKLIHLKSMFPLLLKSTLTQNQKKFVTLFASVIHPSSHDVYILRMRKEISSHYISLPLFKTSTARENFLSLPCMSMTCRLNVLMWPSNCWMLFPWYFNIWLHRLEEEHLKDRLEKYEFLWSLHNVLL